MHEYYKRNAPKLKKTMDSLLKPISSELEDYCGKPYKKIFCEIWDLYEKKFLEHFPYIGDNISETTSLTGAYYFVAMGEILKTHDVDMHQIGHLMALSFERKFFKIPKFIRKIFGKLFRNQRLINIILRKKERKSIINAEKTPGSFESKAILPPEEGYFFSYRYMACPLSDFAKKYGYTEYMPYLCNLDYVMFGAFGAPLYRECTIASGDGYCDFKLKSDAGVMEYWPPVFMQGKGYK